ncbi:MAG: ABC transporter ATP-binding protein [Verrucomicrobiota bacterium]|nr:ABC transporter ATP-binding protein [Verrucomicrobiota bacterium]
MPAETSPLLTVEDLHVQFGQGTTLVKAVSGISFSINAGEPLAIVGESGSGKSTAVMALTRLLSSTQGCDISGTVRMRGRSLLELGEKDLRSVRGGSIGMIFQEPSASLNPCMTIGEQLREVIHVHDRHAKRTAVEAETLRLLEAVGIRKAPERLRDYPWQLSGGMQQRVAIALAIAPRPALLIADEPTTALDATIQKQILDLLLSIRSEFGMAILLITHNFGIVSGFAERVAVMFRGKIVEHGPTRQILAHPQHPYTKALIECVPRLGVIQPKLKTIDYVALEAVEQATGSQSLFR